MEMVRIHSCKTGEYVDRERTPEEQAAIDAERQARVRNVRKSELQLLKERVAALESALEPMK